MADRFTAGVQFVSLSAITNPELVPTALADALKIKQIANRSVPQLIGDQLQNSGPFLLLLDNFERVHPRRHRSGRNPGSAMHLSKILVTSRSSLRIYGEQEFPVTPLAQNSAVRYLFAQRAAAVWPISQFTQEKLKAVVQEICLRPWMDCRWRLSSRLRRTRLHLPAPSLIACNAACNC